MEDRKTIKYLVLGMIVLTIWSCFLIKNNKIKENFSNNYTLNDSGTLIINNDLILEKNINFLNNNSDAMIHSGNSKLNINSNNSVNYLSDIFVHNGWGYNNTFTNHKNFNIEGVLNYNNINNSFKNLSKIAEYISNDGINFNLPGHLIVKNLKINSNKMTLGSNKQISFEVKGNNFDINNNNIKSKIIFEINKNPKLEFNESNDLPSIDKEDGYHYFLIRCVSGLYEGYYLINTYSMYGNHGFHINYAKLNNAKGFIFRVSKTFKTNQPVDLEIYDSNENNFLKCWIHDNNSYLICKDSYPTSLSSSNNIHIIMPGGANEDIKEGIEYQIKSPNGGEILGSKDKNYEWIAGVSSEIFYQYKYKFIFI